MNKKQWILTTLCIGAFSILFLSNCEPDKPDTKDVPNESMVEERRSHNMGKNCLTCHYPNGPGKGRFSVCGTVFDSTENTGSPDGKVILYSGPNSTGTTLMTIDIDGNGNFFTTRSVDLSGGVYPTIQNKSGSKKIHMQISTISGGCNSCHDGNTANKLSFK